MFEKALAEVDKLLAGCVSDSNPFNGNAGLAKFEARLGLSPSGDESERIAILVSEISRKVTEWERMLPSALRRDHDTLSACFAVTEHAEMAAYVTNGILPNYWWAHLVIRLDDVGLYNRLCKQIHRETHLLVAQQHLNEVRSVGGQKAGNRRRREAESRHTEWINKARRLIDSGHHPREVSGIIAGGDKGRAKQVRTVLQGAGIVPQRKSGK